MTQEAQTQNDAKAAAAPSRDGADSSLASYAPENQALHTEAMHLAYGPNARDNYPNLATSVSLATIQNGELRFDRANYGMHDPRQAIDEIAYQPGDRQDRAVNGRRGENRAPRGDQRRDGADRQDRPVDQNIVNDFRRSMQELAGQRGNKDTQLDRRVGQFLDRVNRGQIGAADAEKIMTDLMALQRGDGVRDGGVRNDDTRRALVAGIVDNLAQPDKIDQTGTNTCNATTVQEQLYRFNPQEAVARARNLIETGEYGARTTDAQGNLTNTEFRAKLPPGYMRTLDQLAAGDQTADGALNAATSTMNVGMLNHFWQQRGKYYSIERPDGQRAINGSDTNGEFLADFRAGQANPFTGNKTTIGNPNTDLYAVADMGRSAGLHGAFVMARPGFLRADRQHSGIAVIRSDADLNRAMTTLRDENTRLGRRNVDSAIMGMNVANVYRGQQGGHVVSISRLENGQYKISDQNGNSPLEDRVTDGNTLYAYMNNPGANEAVRPPRGEYLDTPQRRTPHYDSPGVIRGREWQQRYGNTEFERQREEERKRNPENPQRRAENEQNPAEKAERDRDRAARREQTEQQARSRATAQTLAAQIDQLQARLDQLETSMRSQDRSQASQLSGMIANLQSNLNHVSAA